MNDLYQLELPQRRPTAERLVIAVPNLEGILERTKPEPRYHKVEDGFYLEDDVVRFRYKRGGGMLDESVEVKFLTTLPTFNLRHLWADIKSDGDLTCNDVEINVFSGTFIFPYCGEVDGVNVGLTHKGYSDFLKRMTTVMQNASQRYNFMHHLRQYRDEVISESRKRSEEVMIARESFLALLSWG